MAATAKKPWSMKWIILAIVLFIGAYTYLTLAFRKPGKASEPYQDAKDRVTSERLVSAGYKQIVATTERPAEPQRTRGTLSGNAADIHAALGGLTPELKEIFIDQPVLADDFVDVTAASVATAMLPYQVLFTCKLPDLKGLPADTRVYIKEDKVAIVPNFERIEGELLTRTKESPILLSLPGGSLESGRTYQVTLIGGQGSRQWVVQVN